MSNNAPVRAAVWMLGAIVSFTAMAIAGRELGGLHDTFEIMTYRSLIGVSIVICVAGWAGTLKQVSRRRLGLHSIRNISHFAGQNLWFYAITAAPLAQVFALEFTTPIWVTLMAPLLLGERLTPMRALAAIMGFCGVLIVAQPGTAASLSPGLVAAALAAVGFAGAAICTRLLTRTETITSILFYLTVMQAVFGLLAAGADGDIAMPSTTSLPWLIIVGISGLLAHFCITKALAIAPVSVVMPIDFARLPIIALVGMLLYSEQLDWAIFLGAIIIFAANYLNIRHENRPKPAG